MANRYWEVEKPEVIEGEKSVMKVYKENGKIQVFPKVEGTRFGIGRGATMDLETMSVDALLQMKEAIDQAIQIQLTTEDVV